VGHRRGKGHPQSREGTLDDVNGDDVFAHCDLYATPQHTMEHEAEPKISDGRFNRHFANLLKLDRGDSRLCLTNISVLYQQEGHKEWAGRTLFFSLCYRTIGFNTAAPNSTRSERRPSPMSNTRIDQLIDSVQTAFNQRPRDIVVRRNFHEL
jgi:hypothetical protein